MGVPPFQTLEAGGWHISAEAYADGDLDKERVLSWALHNDLRKVGLPSLPKDINRVDTKLRGPRILQVVDVRDVCCSFGASATSSASGRGRLLRIRLTDGHTTATAMEFKPMPNITVDLVPGTKVSLGDVVVKMGVILLKPGSLTVVGGEVEELVQTWEMERKYGAAARAAAGTAQGDTLAGRPPPFKGVHGHKQEAKDGASKATPPFEPTGPGATASHPVGLPAASPRVPATGTGQSALVSAAMGSRIAVVPVPSQRQTPGMQATAGGAQSLPDMGRASAVAAALALAGSRQGQAPVSSTMGGTPPPASAHLAPVPALAMAGLPIQNKSAAQKLLEHRNPSPERSYRARGGRRGRGRGRYRDDNDGDDGSMTLEEYEAIKAARASSAQGARGNAGSSGHLSQIESDHELALRLQRELDLAEEQELRSHGTSMSASHLLSFTYANPEEDNDYGGDHRGGRRGRPGIGGGGRPPGARGGGRGRGRGRGH